MRELGMVLFGCMILYGFFATMIYPNLEYTGHARNSACTGECYKEYVRMFGTPAEQEIRKRELAAGDPFSSIKSLLSGCAACHGTEGQGMGVFPKLAGQSADYITGRLYQYQNNETVGNMSSTMWAQAGMLSEQDIETLGQFIEETMK